MSKYRVEIEIHEEWWVPSGQDDNVFQAMADFEYEFRAFYEARIVDTEGETVATWDRNLGGWALDLDAIAVGV